MIMLNDYQEDSSNEEYPKGNIKLHRLAFIPVKNSIISSREFSGKFYSFGVKYMITRGKNVWAGLVDFPLRPMSSNKRFRFAGSKDILTYEDVRNLENPGSSKAGCSKDDLDKRFSDWGRRPNRMKRRPVKLINDQFDLPLKTVKTIRWKGDRPGKMNPSCPSFRFNET